MLLLLNCNSLNGAVVALRADWGATAHIKLALADAEQLASTNLLVKLMVRMMIKLMVTMMTLVLTTTNLLVKLVVSMMTLVLTTLMRIRMEKTHLFFFLPPAITVLNIENVIHFPLCNRGRIF